MSIDTQSLTPQTLPHTGGYVMLADECWSFRTAVCRADGWGQLTLEAEGADCTFDLPRVLDAGRTGCIEDILGREQPFSPGSFDDDALAGCGLVLGGRCLSVLDVRATLTEYDAERGLLCAELTVTAESDDGTFRAEFEMWLACEYREDVLSAAEAN
jgi:hypothetical protein